MQGREDSSRDKAKRAACGAAGYAGAFLLLSYPLVLHLSSSVVAHWGMDIEHAFWTRWWVGKALASPELSIFRTSYLHAPFGVSLELADINLGIILPFIALSSALGVPLAYNVLLLAAFVASGLAAGALCRRLTRCTPAAAWVAGLFFAASSYWISTMLNGWIYLVHMWVLPLVLLAVERALARGRALDWALVGATLGAAFWITPHYLVFGIALLLPLAAHHAVAVERGAAGRARVRGVLVAAAILVVLVIGRAAPMAAEAREEHVAHHRVLDARLGASLVEFVLPSAEAVEARRQRLGYDVVFVGYTLVALVASGVAFGGRRREYAPWLLGALLFDVLAIGPYLKLSDRSVIEGVKLPAYWLSQAPVFSTLTNHWRWTCPSLLCLSLAAALAMRDLSARFASRPRVAALALAAITLALGVEQAALSPLPWRRPLWRVRVAPIATALRDEPGVRAVMDRTMLPKLSQTVHGRPIAAGWLPRLDVTTDARTTELFREMDARTGLEDRVRFLSRNGFDALVLSDRSAIVIDDGGLDGTPARWHTLSAPPSSR